MILLRLLFEDSRHRLSVVASLDHVHRPILFNLRQRTVTLDLELHRECVLLVLCGLLLVGRREGEKFAREATGALVLPLLGRAVPEVATGDLDLGLRIADLDLDVVVPPIPIAGGGAVGPCHLLRGKLDCAGPLHTLWLRG